MPSVISRIPVKDANSVPQFFKTLYTGTDFISYFVPSDNDGNAYSNTNPLNVKLTSSNISISTGSSVIGRVGLQIGGIDLSSSNPIPIMSSGNVSITGSVTSTLTSSNVIIGRVGLQVLGSDVSSLNPIPTNITNSLTISNFPTSTSINGSVVLGTGNNIVGKFGLQVSGTDISTSNPIPIIQTSNVVVSVNNFPVVQNVSINNGSNVIGKVGLQIGGSDVSSVSPLPVYLNGTQTVSVINFPSSTSISEGNNTIGKVNLQTPDGIVISANNPLPVLFSGNIVVNNTSTSTTLNPGNNFVGKVGIQLGGLDITPSNPLSVSLPVGSVVNVANFPTSTSITGNVVVSVNNFPTSTTIGTGSNLIGKVTIQSGGVDVSNTNPMAVFANSLPLPSGAATASNQSAQIAALGSISDAAWSGTGTSSIISAMKAMSVKYINGVLGKVGLQISGADVSNTNPVPMNVMNNITVGNFPPTQTVSGTVNIGNLPSTQTVSGTVSVGNLPATQNVSGSISVSNFPTTQAVSGTVNIGNLPSTQSVSGTVSVGNFPSAFALNASSNIIGKVGIQNGGVDNANSNPLFVSDYQNKAIQSVSTLSLDQTVTPGRLFAVNCTNPGNLNVVFPDDTSFLIPLDIGLNIFPFAVKSVASSGTTATALYYVLR